jgi:menaquinone-dependent protoporphyrinogen IX oxidase
MNKIILYGSKYGTTKEYAQEFSKRTNIDILEYSKVKNLENYDLIIYFGGLYAGGILGLKDTINKYPLNNNQKLIVVTVGLADPTVKSNTDDIKTSLKKQISKELYDNCKIFHLRGGVDYSKLSTVHKIMMKALYNRTKKLPAEKQTEETKALIETYNKKVTFVDFDSLNPIIDFI